MHQFEFTLNLSPQAYEAYYRGSIHTVLVRCHTGSTVQFPAQLLQPFVTMAGVRGTFMLTCDAQGKGATIRRL